MFLTFPNFNIYSTPLLVLVSQGVLFGILLLLRFRKEKNLSDLFLALLVLITCYHRTTYTIGFMDWYDTYRNTKINYYLIWLGLAIGPLIYFYVKSVTTARFNFRKRDWWHFTPVLVYVLYRISIFAYDSQQPGFSDTQNGILMTNLEMPYMSVFFEAIFTGQQLLYLAFTLQLYYKYRHGIQHYFSNTYNLELNWIRNFLFLYTFLFVYSVVQQVVDLSIIDLSWIQKWWYQFFSTLVVLYIGIKGYFTNTSTLEKLEWNPIFKVREPEILDRGTSQKISADPDAELRRQALLEFMDVSKPYLNPDLNLIELAERLNMSRTELSELVNTGIGKNFNDFINEYRVNAVKELLSKGKQEHMSLVGIALDCGFNSKATFNRVFKKFTQTSPSEFIRSLK